MAHAPCVQQVGREGRKRIRGGTLGAFSVAAELPVLDGTLEAFIENPSMFQIHDDFQNRQVLLFQNFSLELLPNSLATRRRHVVVLAFTHCFDKQF